MRVNKSDIYVNHKHIDIVQSIDLKTHLYEVMRIALLASNDNW